MKNIKPKIPLSIACLLIASFIYGQRDTIYLKPNDSLVIITKGMAIDITKDLIKKDYLEQKVLLLEKDTAVLSQISAKYATELNLASRKETAYKSIIADNNQLMKNYNEYIRKQENELKVSKFKTTASQILLLAASIIIITKL